MNRHIIISTIITFFALSFVTYAHSDVEEENHGKPLEVVLQEIRESQGIGENEKIDPDKVSDEKLEELGDAVMSVMHPDPREHEWMDNMMGGEGSSTLAAMHKIMGYNYLSDSYGGMMGQGMMGGGMMGRGMMGPGMMGRGMMGQGMMDRGMMDFGYGGILMWVLFLILIAVIIYLIIQATKTKGLVASTAETPLEILKKRYAKGEITKGEFEKIRKDLAQ